MMTLGTNARVSCVIVGALATDALFVSETLQSAPAIE
jgi:hypothetical protein